MTEEALFSRLLKQLVSTKETLSRPNLFFKHNGDWPEFRKVFNYHELILFFYPLLRDSDALQQEIKEFLRKNYYLTLKRSEQLWQEFLRIFKAFQEAGILLLPMKGMSFLKDIYRENPVRQMADIDILLREEDLLKAEKIFAVLGYQKELLGLKEEYWRNKQCHITFYKKTERGSFIVEAHWSLDFKRKDCYVLPEFWERTRELDCDGLKIRVLSPEDAVFSLALHNRRFGKPFCLKNAYDAALLLKKYASEFDWDYCLEKSRQYNLYSALYFILYQVKIFFGVNFPESVWQGLAIRPWKKFVVKCALNKYTFSNTKDIQNLYLITHFLLYDSVWEPFDYILHIPQEQFAKFYKLKPYSKKTSLAYKSRWFYIPLRLAFSLGEQSLSRLSLTNYSYPCKDIEKSSIG